MGAAKDCTKLFDCFSTTLGGAAPCTVKGATVVGEGAVWARAAVAASQAAPARTTRFSQTLSQRPIR